MSWGTSFNADIYIYRKIYKSESELDIDIEDTKEYIQSIRENILMLVSSTPKDIMPPGEDWTPLEYSKMTTENYLEELEDSIYKLQRLQILKENFDKRTNDI